MIYAMFWTWNNGDVMLPMALNTNNHFTFHVGGVVLGPNNSP